jgi:Antitoxin VbhA
MENTKQICYDISSETGKNIGDLMAKASVKIVTAISDEERALRKFASRQGAANNAIEGLFSTPAEDALFKRWEDGEFDDDELIAEIHRMNGTTPNA